MFAYPLYVRMLLFACLYALCMHAYLYVCMHAGLYVFIFVNTLYACMFYACTFSFLKETLRRELEELVCKDINQLAEFLSHEIISNLFYFIVWEFSNTALI